MKRRLLYYHSDSFSILTKSKGADAIESHFMPLAQRVQLKRSANSNSNLPNAGGNDNNVVHESVPWTMEGEAKKCFSSLCVMFNRTCSSCSSNQQVSRRIYQSMGSDHERTQSFWHFSNSCGRSGSCNRSQKRKAGVRGLQNGKEKVCLVNVFFWKVLDDNQLNRDILKKVESNKLVRSCLLGEDFFSPFISFFFFFRKQHLRKTTMLLRVILRFGLQRK